MACSRMPKCSTRPLRVALRSPWSDGSGGRNDGCALDGGVVGLGQVGRAAPQLGQHGAIALMHLAGGLAGGDALRVGREGRQGVGPAGGQGAGLQPVEERRRRRTACAPRRRTARLPRGLRGLAALDGLRVCARTSAATSKVWSGSKPRIFLVAATSSAPRAEPWALPVFWALGAGQPMIVRSRMKLGRSVTRLGRLEDRVVQGRDVLVVAPCRRWSSRPSGRASRRPRSARRRPR